MVRDHEQADHPKFNPVQVRSTVVEHKVFTEE
jgi:hypothetical protein